MSIRSRLTRTPAPHAVPATAGPGSNDEPATPEHERGAADQSPVFLGTLRSEVDEPDELTDSFAHLQLVTEGVLSAYRRGTLDQAEAAVRLRLLRLRGAGGEEWTLGSTSLRWYRRYPGGLWKVTPPPFSEDEVFSASADAAVAALTALGAPGAPGAGGAVRPLLPSGAPSLGSVVDALEAAEAARPAVAPWAGAGGRAGGHDVADDVQEHPEDLDDDDVGEVALTAPTREDPEAEDIMDLLARLKAGKSGPS